MANNYGNNYGHGGQGMPPIQTQPYNQNHRAFSPGSFQQSPGAMSPTGVYPPNKRQRLSPNPPNPPSPAYQSPFGTPTYLNSPTSQHLQLPASPAPTYPPPSFNQFNQPQPYAQHNDMNRAPQNSMPPPPVPPAKAQDELEKANAREMDIVNISDVLTGSGIDLRAEEDNLLPARHSFNSQSTATVTPQGSFGQWPSGVSSHGAFHGNGPLTQPVSQEQQEEELIRKHKVAARALGEATQNPLNDPFLYGNKLRQRVAQRAYDHGVTVNLEGLYDKIPEVPQNITRNTLNGETETVRALQADSLLNKNAPFVEVLSLLSLAAEERIRTILDDAFVLSQARKNTSSGVVTPSLLDIAVASAESTDTNAVPINITRTAWEAAPDSAISPMTVSTSKNLNAGRLPTPPTDAPPTPKPTIQVANHVVAGLKRRVVEDFKFEEQRLTKRKKRLNQAATTPSETTSGLLPQIPDKMTKKERDRINKMDQTDDALHKKANETASMALGGIGGKKKYSWMTGGGGGGLKSGTSTPSRINTNLSSGAGSGATTPALQPTDRSLLGRRRTWDDMLEKGEAGEHIQVRDLIHVLELDGKGKRALASVLARLKNTERDEGEKSAAPPMAAR